ncbi:MAG: hypothetical protein QM569_03815 [Acidovorax sp.]|uniref:hypothetical protein n=1 Tax=Acidovorax sp. TaxID=1872122 RepID=UPI0039E33DCE
MIRRADDFETLTMALAHARAMVYMTYGEGGEVFRRATDEHQDSFLWALSERIDAAFAAVKRLEQGGAGMNCNTCAHAHSPLPDGWHHLDFFDRRAVVGQLSVRLDCKARCDDEKPCLKPSPALGGLKSEVQHPFKIEAP